VVVLIFAGLLVTIGLTYMYKSAQVSYWRSETERWKHLAVTTKTAFDEVTLSHSKTLEVLALFSSLIELDISAQELKEKLSKITSNP
jgi:hypothetical protein